MTYVRLNRNRLRLRNLIHVIYVSISELCIQGEVRSVHRTRGKKVDQGGSETPDLGSSFLISISCKLVSPGMRADAVGSSASIVSAIRIINVNENILKRL